MKNNTLKEYYIKLEGLFNDTVNMLTAINQSLYTNGSEVSVTIKDSLNNESVIRIPSFLYLENKLEILSNNFKPVSRAAIKIMDTGTAILITFSSSSKYV